LSPLRPRALKELRSIERVHLQAGESRTVAFTVKASRDLAYYDDKLQRFAVDPGKYEVQAGASSADIRLRKVLEVAGS
jgi:beta-glucosidase